MAYIYINNWTGDLCIPDDLGIAPPEKYLKVTRLDSNDYYVEKWTISGQPGKTIDVSSPAYRYWDTEHGVNDDRHYIEAKHNVILNSIIEWFVPASVFDEWLREYNLFALRD